MANVDIDLGKYSLGWSDPEKNVFKPEKGLNEEIIRKMSEIKEEPEWMLDFRLKAYKRFLDKHMPEWVAKEKLSQLDFDDIYYYIKPTEDQADSWDEVPEEIKQTYEKLGIPEAERTYLAGVTAQYESEVVYHKNREDLEKLGVLFCDMDTLLELSKLSALANMPSREQALSQLAGMLNAPMNQFVSILNQVPSKLVRTLQAVKEQKEQAES